MTTRSDPSPTPSTSSAPPRSAPSVLVLGATGKTGRRVARGLTDLGVTVRAASRSGATRFDWDDPGTWEAAVDGATAAYVVPPVLRLDGTADRVHALADLAASRGVEHLVLLSARGVDQGADDNHLLLCEKAVRSVGIGWTVLRPSWFAHNFSEDWWAAGVRAGTLALPAGDGAEPFVHVDDIADVAVAALTGGAGSPHAGRTYELSGPRALPVAEAVDLIGRAIGHEVAYVDVDADAFVAERVAAGVPDDYARLLAELLAIVGRGWDAELSRGTEQALDRPARPFEDYVAEAAAASAWG